MTDPYLYIGIMFLVNVFTLPAFLILTEKGIVYKTVKTVLVMALMTWQAAIYLSR